jgi:hypothetical protein
VKPSHCEFLVLNYLKLLNFRSGNQLAENPRPGSSCPMQSPPPSLFKLSHQSAARNDAALQNSSVLEASSAPVRPISGSAAAASIRAREFIKTPGGAAIVHNTVLEQKHGSEYYKRRHLLEMVKVLSLTTMEQAESIQQLSSRVAKLELELEKIEPLRQLLQQLDEVGSSDSVASSIVSLLQQAKPPTSARTNGLRPTTSGSMGAFSAHLSATDFMDSHSKLHAIQSECPSTL